MDVAPGTVETVLTYFAGLCSITCSYLEKMDMAFCSWVELSTIITIYSLPFIQVTPFLLSTVCGCQDVAVLL